MKGLIVVDVIILVKYNNKKYIKIRVFKLRFINEIKNKFNKLYEKSWLIVWGFKDNNKNVMFI